MTDFNIPDFLRAIGKGPEERPEWWRKCWHAPNGGIPIDDLPESVECETWEPTECPFATILGKYNWTPEKDALLLGAGLEYARLSDPDTHSKIFGALEKQFPGYAITQCYGPLDWLLFICDRPGLTLARAIWDALKGGNQ